jgi:hypothetical protein
MTTKSRRDYRVTLGGLILANIIIAVGFVVEYGLIDLTFTAIGLAGILSAVFAALWFVFWLVEYLAGD